MIDPIFPPTPSKMPMASRLMVPPSSQQGGAQSAVNHEQVRKTAQDFAAVFFQEMLQPMFDSLPTDGAFHGGHAENVFRGQLLQEYGKIIAKSPSSAPLVDSLTHQILKLQETPHGN
jgi:Rod binding domain-containing protein